MSEPFDPTTRVILVQTRLVGPSGSVLLRLALDTGATRTLIDPDYLTAAGYDPDNAPTRGRITTGSGIETPPLVTVDAIHALGLERTSLTVLGHTLPPTARIDGLLGLDFRRGTCLTIDFRAGLITLA